MADIFLFNCCFFPQSKKSCVLKDTMVCIFLRRILQDLAFYSTLVSLLFKEQNPDNLPVLHNGLATSVNMVSSYCISLANLVISFITYFMLSSSLSSLSSRSLFSTSPIILPQNPLQVLCFSGFFIFHHKLHISLLFLLSYYSCSPHPPCNIPIFSVVCFKLLRTFFSNSHKYA